MAESGHLQADPLFQGLTRPAMILGVSYTYFVINSIFNLLIFINTSNFFYLFVSGPIIHCIGYLICLREPRAVELAFLVSSKCWKVAPFSRVRKFHGFTNSYDVY